MNDFDSDLSAGLGALLDIPAPPSAMNADRAIRTGSAIKRKRRRTAAGSAVALLGAVALVVAVLLPGAGHGSTPAPAGSPTGTPTATVGPTPVLTGTDPLVQTLVFGWLPTGVTTADFQYQGYPAVGGIPAPSRTLDAAGGSTSAGLRVSAQVAGGQTPAGPVPVTTLDGHPAQISVGATSATLDVYDVDGLNVFIVANSVQAIADVNAVGGLAAYFHTLTLLGPDAANWTTAVVG